MTGSNPPGDKQTGPQQTERKHSGPEPTNPAPSASADWSYATALTKAQTALARHWDAVPATPLQDPDGPARQAYLFSAYGPKGHITVKLWAPNAAERALKQVRRQMALAEAMSSGPFRVPEPIFFDPDTLAFGMRAITGHDLRQGWQANPDPDLGLAAGRWLAAFHGPSLRPCAFNPKGQVNWLARLIEAGESGARTIVDLPAFTQAAQTVQAMGPALADLPATRAVTHRDMTLSNLLLDVDGTLWGIDFENPREDEPLRDVFTLALDFLSLGSSPDTGRAAVDHLRQGYGDTTTAPTVRLFLQRCFCLWVWANTPVTPSARQLARLEIAEQLLHMDQAIL